MLVRVFATIRPFRLILLAVTLLCLSQPECIGQSQEQNLRSYDYYNVKDTLFKLSVTQCDSFYTSILRDKSLDACMRMSFTCDHGSVLMDKDDPVAALRKAQTAIEFEGACDDTLAYAKLNLLFGRIYKATAQHDRALEHLLEARKMAESIKPSFLNFDVNINAAMLLYEARNHAGAIEFLKTAHEIYRQHPHVFRPVYARKALMGSYNTLGLAYRHLGHYKAAIENFFKSRAIARELKDEFWVGLVNGNAGMAYYNLGARDSALYYLKMDAAISLKHKQWPSLMNAFFTLGNIHEDEGDAKMANYYYDSLESLLKLHPYEMFPQYYEKQSELSFTRGEYRKAMKYYKKFHRQSDSLLRLETSSNLSRIQDNYEAEKMLADLELIKKDVTIKNKEVAIQKSLLIGSILIVLLLVAVLYMGLRRYSENKALAKILQAEVEDRTRELTESNAELDTFLYRASHDFRGPLSTLMGLHNLGKLTINDPEALSLFRKVGEVVRVMDRMLKKVAAMSFINQKNPEVALVNLNQLASSVIKQLDLEVADSRILNLIDQSINIRTNPDLLRITLENLIENAARSRERNLTLEITLSSAIAASDVHIMIKDTGKGIDEEYHEKIFRPFFRVHGEPKGNGLGLYLVKKSVLKLQGDIRLYSRPGEGTTFTLILPLEQKTPGVPVNGPIKNGSPSARDIAPRSIYQQGEIKSDIS